MTLIIYMLFFYSIKYIGGGMYSLLIGGPWCCVAIINGTLRSAAPPTTQRTDEILGHLDLTLWQNYWTT